MSTPDSVQHIWTSEELESLTRRELVATTKSLGLKAGGVGSTSPALIKNILEFQRSNLADAFPPPAEPSPEVLPEPSPEVLPEPSLPGPSPELSPELPQESRPRRHGVSVYEDPGQTAISPQKAGSLGSNPSQSQDSASSGHLSLGTNNSPRKDKGKGKATETAAAEQPKGSSGEISSSPTNILHQPASTAATHLRKAKARRPRGKLPRGGESGVAQNQEPNQNNESQETLQVQQIVLASDNSGSSLNLSNSNGTLSSVQSFQASFESRLKKLESSASVESVQNQVTDLHKDLESLKSELGTFKDQVLELKTQNSELLEHNSRLRMENADLKAQVSTFEERLAMLEGLFNGRAPARGSNSSSSTDLEGESAPRLGSPQPIDEARTPQPDTTPKAPLRHLEGPEVASGSEHPAGGESNAPFSLPAFSPPPPTLVGPVGPAEIRPTSHLPSGSRQPQPSSTPGGSHPLEYNKKRKLEEPESGPSAALDAGVPPKRVKPNSSPEELVEDPASFQRERRVGEDVRGNFTTPPNPPPPNTPSADPLNSRPDFPFNQGSPSPQQRRPPRTPLTPATRDPRHRVPSPTRRPETQSSSMQLNTPFVGGAIPVRMVAVPVRGNHARRTPEPTSSRVGPNHVIASSALASAVGGVFDPPSSSTPARPGPSLVMRTPTTTSRPTTRTLPYERLPLINGSPRLPPPPPPVIPTAGPSTENHDGGGSQSSDGTNSDSANQVPASTPVGTMTGGTVTGSHRVRMQPIAGAQLSGALMQPITGAELTGALDPYRFTGAIQRRRGQANPPTSTTPDSSMRQGAPETPMASPTRYGTEINPSMRHLY